MFIPFLGQTIADGNQNLSAVTPIADKMLRCRDCPLRSSRPEEFHLQALPEPCVNLSIHTAPDVRPLPCHSCQ
jgi:hypothetical protein